MPRLLSPDDGCVSVKVPSGYGTETVYNGRVIDVESPSHIKRLRAEGYVVAGLAGAPVHRAGFDCECGFSSFFRKCGRCGAACERPE